MKRIVSIPAFLFTIVLLTLIPTISHPQAGLDNSFGTGGKVTTQVTNINTGAYGTSMVMQPDGKIVVVGSLLNRHCVLVRYDSTGKLDNIFGQNGIVTTDFYNGNVGSAQLVAIQDDGKIIVTGTFMNSTKFEHMLIARYKSNGILDSSFGDNGKATTGFNFMESPMTIAIQKDNKIIVAGSASGNFYLSRFNNNGTLDISFGESGKVITSFSNQSGIKAIKITYDEKIIAAGYYYDNYDYKFALAKYNPDGSLDTTFNSGGKTISKFIGMAHSIAELSDGSLCVAGYTMNDNITLEDFSIAKYNSDGTLNNSFGTLGVAKTDIDNSVDYANSILEESDGKLIVLGTAETYAKINFAVIRYNPDGTLDNSFGTNGKVITDFDNAADNCNSASIQPDGKIIAVGTSTDTIGPAIALVKYNLDGTLDNSFGINGKLTTDLKITNDIVYSVAVQKDGKIIAAGVSNDLVYDLVAIAKYNLDGSMDNTFGNAGIVHYPWKAKAKAIILSKDKIIAFGYYSSTSLVCSPDFMILRYDISGNLDNSFGTGGFTITDINITHDYGNSLAMQPDGRIVVAGSSIGRMMPVSDFFAARYNPDGSLDKYFGTDGKVVIDFENSNDFGNSLAILPDLKTIIAGSSNNGTNNDFAMVRLNADGTIDNNFGLNGKVKTDIQNSEDYESSMLIQPDQKIILVGYSSIIGEGHYISMVRYNPDGAIDSTFGTNGKVFNNLGTAFDSASAAVLQPDGKIVVVGNTSNSFNSDFIIIRFNNNGVLDETFGNNGVVTIDFGNTNDKAYSVALQENGEIIAAGSTDNGYSSDFALLRYEPLNPVIQSSSQSLQFGDVSIDNSVIKSFYVRNLGNGPLVVDSIASNEKNFSTDLKNFNVAPGDSQEIKVSFKPSDKINYSRTLFLYHDTYYIPETLNLKGKCTDKVVPVELTSLSGKVFDNAIILNWKTSTETNNKGFEVERKLNSGWEKISYVNGNGTTTNPKEYSYTDNFKFQSFKGIVSYRLMQIDLNGSYHYSDEIKLDVDFTPKEFTLYQNYPNPFNPATTIKYAVPYESSVKIIIYNPVGQRIKEFNEGIKDADYYDITWQPENLSSGIYFYSIIAKSIDGKNNYTKTLKMLYMK